MLIWKAVPGFEGLYEVSSDGRVRGLRGGREMALISDTPGYLTVKLYKGGKVTRQGVHRLVCRAFHGEPFDGAQVAHLNGVRTDNRAENLQWATSAENNAHKVIHGTRQSGNRNGRAKFDEGRVAQVRELHRGGYSEALIAGHTGVSKSHVHRIIAGETRAEGIAQPTPSENINGK